ncbi:MAG: TetR/AcrR family transcriptional regulator [Candidatus Caenarcaniphilales bacterium]|jgi:AcrR family transcriptional regulator|nr:TetR/AcrR family transcriptional regulator [Candidatus Caenarcaniphilales bacterium]
MLALEPKTHKSKQTKLKILSVAKDVFSQRGFQKATVKDITTAADLGYGTFYLYFKDKKEVFYALVEQVEEELFTAAHGGSDLNRDYERGISSYRALRKDLRSILQSFKDNDSVLRFSRELALIDDDFKTKYESMRARLIERTRQILHKSGLHSVDLSIAAVAIAGMIESTALEWAKGSSQDPDLDIERVLPTLTKLYFKAVS